MFKKALVVFNLTAGLLTKQDVEKMVREKLETLDYTADLFYLDQNFERNISGYNFKNIKLVVAVGGDGTVKVAARTVLANKIQAPLVIIPFGSANVVAAALGIPLDVKKALKLLDHVNQTLTIDVGFINKTHYFLVGFSVGYISQIVTGTSRRLKNRLGFLSYALKFIFNKIKIKKVKFKIMTKNRTFWVKGNSLIVFNTLNYYGLKPKKPIDLMDGILNLYVFTNRTFLTLIEAFFYLLLFHHPPKHVFALDNNYFKIFLKKEQPSCQIDGDYIKLPKGIEIEVMPKAIEVVVIKK